MKVEKKGEDQIKYDESKFFRPLADLGIEFKQKDGKIEEEERYPERVEKQHSAVNQPGIIGAIKKVFTPSPVRNVVDKKIPPQAKKDNFALKEVLSKIDAPAPAPASATASGGVSPQAAILLDSLKEKISARGGSASGGKVSKDRAASQEEMDKLRNLISEKTEKDESALAPSVSPGPSASPTAIPKKPKASSVGPQPREVPEDVLRKILE